MPKISRNKHLPYGVLLRDGGIVHVEIGPDRVRYAVHKDLLTQYSGYFQGALSHRWQEAEDKKITLEDVDTGTFNVFVQWLYTGYIPEYDKDWIYAMEVDENRPVFQSYIAELAAVKAIVFGDRFLAPRFRAETHNWLVKRLVSSKAEAWNQTIIYAFEHLASDDKLLSFFTEMHARHFEEMGVVDESKKEDGDDEMVQVEDDLESELPIEFMVSCMKKMALLRAPSQGTVDVHKYRISVSDLEEEEYQNTAIKVSLVNLKSGGGVGLNITARSVVSMKCAQQ